MRRAASPAAAILLLLGCVEPLSAQTAASIDLSKFPHVAIISPVFYWDGAVQGVRTISATCPQGRAVGGGVSLPQGNASLRIRESYADGSSWVLRVVSHGGEAAAQTMQVRAFALCLLPVARSGSVPIAQYPRLLHLSQQLSLPPGGMRTAGRQACAQNTLVISGGFGLDPQYDGPSRVRMELSFPDKWAWNVRAVNGGDAAQPAAGARIHAFCLGSDEGLNIRAHRTVSFADANVTVKAGGATVRQSISCGGASAYAIAGGARIVGGKTAEIEMQESFPDRDGSWTIALVNLAPPASGDAKVRLYATCIER
jgi:hypothetical protein